MRFKLANQVQNSKKLKKIVEGHSYKIASLTVVKSIELHAYNQFNQDSYRHQANAINNGKVVYSNTYNLRWRNHPNFSQSQGFQQNRMAAPAPPMQPIH